MHFNILTIFPEMFPGTLGAGVVGRALERKIWSYDAINIRDFAHDNYGSVDDEQFGGGAGQVMDQKMVREFSWVLDGVYTLVCGRYEGIDQRVIDEYGIMELSIGDYILSGGEIAAQVFVDSVVRVMDNVVGGGADATANESFEIGGLEWPLYTRPSAWRGRNVPEVLLSGHHGNIERWRKQQSDEITKQRRPDLIKEK